MGTTPTGFQNQAPFFRHPTRIPWPLLQSIANPCPTKSKRHFAKRISAPRSPDAAPPAPIPRKFPRIRFVNRAQIPVPQSRRAGLRNGIGPARTTTGTPPGSARISFRNPAANPYAPSAKSHSAKRNPSRPGATVSPTGTAPLARTDPPDGPAIPVRITVKSMIFKSLRRPVPDWRPSWTSLPDAPVVRLVSYKPGVIRIISGRFFRVPDAGPLPHPGPPISPWPLWGTRLATLRYETGHFGVRAWPLWGTDWPL